MSERGNLKFWCVVMAALLLIGGLGWFVYSNNQKVDELKQKYAQSDVSGPRNINAGSTATVSKESEQHVVDKLNITFRAVGLNRESSAADRELAFNVLNEIRNSPYFDATNAFGVGEVSQEVPLSEPPVKSKTGETAGTFSFKIVAKLERPLTL
jgi:cytoskeletal protein RodZ